MDYTNNEILLANIKNAQMALDNKLENITEEEYQQLNLIQQFLVREERENQT